MPERMSWDEYFMAMAELASKRSTCLRRQVGAVAVIDKRVVATGYNGAPSGAPHCSETGCWRQLNNIPSGERHETCRAQHAEGNLVAQAARYGTSLSGATVYCTHQPCAICAKLMVASGIRSVCYAEGYPDNLAMQVFNEAGVTVRQLEND